MLWWFSLVLIDWIEFYDLTAIFQPCNGGFNGNLISLITCLLENDCREFTSMNTCILISYTCTCNENHWLFGTPFLKKVHILRKDLCLFFKIKFNICFHNPKYTTLSFFSRFFKIWKKYPKDFGQSHSFQTNL